MQPNTPATETGTSPDTRIIEAAKNGNIDQIRALIAEQVDLNARDREDNTALHLASEKGHTEIVTLIMNTRIMNAKNEKGADNLVSDELPSVNPTRTKDFSVVRLAGQSKEYDSRY